MDMMFYWAEYNRWELWLNSESGRYINPRTMRGPFYEKAEVPDSAYDDGRVLQKTIADLRRLREQEKPFFLACGFWNLISLSVLLKSIGTCIQMLECLTISSDQKDFLKR